jgi:hypothetical protein
MHSRFWLSSCVLVLGLEIQEHKNQRKVRQDLGCAAILFVRTSAMDLGLGVEFSQVLMWMWSSEVRCKCQAGDVASAPFAFAIALSRALFHERLGK